MCKVTRRKIKNCAHRSVLKRAYNFEKGLLMTVLLIIVNQVLDSLSKIIKTIIQVKKLAGFKRGIASSSRTRARHSGVRVVEMYAACAQFVRD